MDPAKVSSEELTDKSQLESQTEEIPPVLHKHQVLDTASEDGQHHHKNKKKKRTKRHKEKKSRKSHSEHGEAGDSEEKLKEEVKSERFDNTAKGDTNNPGEETLPETEEEARKGVSWKEDIETSQEFQASVLEQNVVVNLEVPDEEYEGKARSSEEDGELESYTWDPANCGPNISVNDKKPYIAQRLIARQSTDGARGSRGFTEGRHTFRFKFNDTPWGSNCSIGVCTAHASLNQKGYCHLFGKDAESWAWDIPSGSLHHNGQVTQHYISAIEEKLIYMTVDFNKGYLYFQPKDRDRFLAFKGITGDKELFPCVSMVYGLAEVKIGLKHSTANSVKILKQERESRESKSKQSKKNLEQPCETQNRNDLNVSSISQKSTEEDRNSSEPELDQTTNQPQESKTTLGEEVDTSARKDGIDTEDVEQVPEDGSEPANDDTADTDEDSLLQENRRTSIGSWESESKVSTSEVTRGAADEDEICVVTSSMSRGQPDGEKQGDPERDRLYKKSSTLSWADSWQDNDLYVVENGTILRESLKDQELSDLEEPEDAQYTHIGSLDNFDQYGIQLSHGWDVTSRGGTIHLYPNIPYLCVPMPHFSDKVQGIRGRQGFKEGIHKWKVTEIKSFSPNVPLDEMHLTANKLHIGVVSEDQRTYNFGYNLTSVGPHAWTYEVDTGLVWHGQSKITDLTLAAGAGTSSQIFPYVDATKGIEVELNFYKHQLTLRYEDKVIAQIKHIRATQLYPFLLFNKKAVFPVEIQYVEGPEGYVTESLTRLEKMDSLDREELVNYRGLTRQMSSKTNIVVVEHELMNTYNWGQMSRGMKIKTLSGGNTIQLAKGAFALRKHFVALAEKPIFGQRHKIDFTAKHIDSCIFGLASEHLDKTLFDKEGGIDNTEVTVSILGDNVHSWAWDPKTCSLYHAGRYLGRYPSRAVDFQDEQYDCLRLLVDFSSTGYNIASFTAMSTESRRSTDLGIAFVNLPSSVYPCVAVLTGGEKENVQVALDYVSGPKGFVTDIVQAKTCSIL